MQRRKFVRNTTVAALGLPLSLKGMNLTAHADNPALHQLLLPGTANDHILVVVQLNGGNDGLNTVIPRDQYSRYVNARANIAIPENRILPITGTSLTGLHPSLTGIRDLYNDGKVCIVQSVGYPNPNFSHFRATDIWMTAAESNQYLNDGWLGRYLNGEYSGYPNGYPNTGMPDPLAIQFGSGTSLVLQGPSSPMGYTISDPNAFINNANGGQDTVPTDTPMGIKLQYVRDVARQAEVFNAVVQSAYNRTGNNNLTTYPSNKLADQLKIVARLINGGLKTKIYVVNLGGFDTHANQTNTGDTLTGDHATLMSRLGDSIKAFQTDLTLMNQHQRVLGMTFSEFGRRIKSNSSGGTDHGYAAPMFIFGTKATGGIIGTNPVLPASAGTQDNIALQHDFRSVYYSIMKRWLCQDSNSLQQIMLQNFTDLNICNNADCAPLGRPERQPQDLISSAPNPAAGSTTVSFTTAGGHTVLQLLTKEGNFIKTIHEQVYAAGGTHSRQVDLNGLKSDLYYIRIQNGSRVQMKPLIKVR